MSANMLYAAIVISALCITLYPAYVFIQKMMSAFYVCCIYPLFTNYRCILITGVFCFLQMTVTCDIIIRHFPLNIVCNAFFSLHQRKNAEMSFLSVSDLNLVCIVQNHDADSPLYIIKNDIFMKVNEKLPLEKYVYLLWKILTAWLPA